jgi:hypothetical protein
VEKLKQEAKESKRRHEQFQVCVCAHVCVRMCVSVCVCVCV